MEDGRLDRNILGSDTGRAERRGQYGCHRVAGTGIPGTVGSVQNREEPQKNPQENPELRKRRVATGVLVVILALFAVPYLYQRQEQATKTKVRLDEVISYVQDGKVEEAKIDEAKRRIEVTLKDGEKVVYAGYPDGYGGDLVEKLSEAKTPVEVGEVTTSGLPMQLLFVFGPYLLMGFIIFSVFKKVSSGGGIKNAIVGSKNQVEVPETRFKDVAGCDEAVEDLREVVEFLKDNERYERLGARVPRGVLLVGPPGTGKTLLARATAGEAGVPFFALSGSDFVEMFVGVGASRVRGLFEKARKAGRAIVFIDEIDAVGKQRSGGFASGANDERESTLNALLVEMDGFEQSGVIVLAATNRADILDQALLRPGRFDRRVTVGLPDRKGREKLFEIFLEKAKLVEGAEPSVLARDMAKRSTGMSGADIAAVCNEAALGAAKDAAVTGIGRDHLDDALERVALGRERRSVEVSERAGRITAWHEAGHAVVAMMTEHAMKPERVSIVPRGGAGGATWFASEDDEHFQTKSEALANLAVSYGGRAGEEILLDGDYTQGAAGDIQQATRIAEHMVFDWGMSEYGLVKVERDRRLESDDEAGKYVRELLDGAITDAREVLRENRALLEAVAEALLEQETLSREDLQRIKESVGL